VRPGPATHHPGGRFPASSTPMRRSATGVRQARRWPAADPTPRANDSAPRSTEVPCSGNHAGSIGGTSLSGLRNGGPPKPSSVTTGRAPTRQREHAPSKLIARKPLRAKVRANAQAFCRPGAAGSRKPLCACHRISPKGRAGLGPHRKCLRRAGAYRACHSSSSRDVPQQPAGRSELGGHRLPAGPCGPSGPWFNLTRAVQPPHLSDLKNSRYPQFHRSAQAARGDQRADEVWKIGVIANGKPVHKHGPRRPPLIHSAQKVPTRGGGGGGQLTIPCRP